MKMLAAAHGRNRDERPGCCEGDDKFSRLRWGKRLRKRIQRRREERAWRKEE